MVFLPLGENSLPVPLIPPPPLCRYPVSTLSCFSTGDVYRFGRESPGIYNWRPYFCPGVVLLRQVFIWKSGFSPRLLERYGKLVINIKFQVTIAPVSLYHGDKVRTRMAPRPKCTPIKLCRADAVTATSNGNHQQPPTTATANDERYNSFMIPYMAYGPLGGRKANIQGWLQCDT